MKYLLLFAFLGVVWWIFSKRKALEDSKPSSTRPAPAEEKMVTCVHCGVHLPESEGISDGGRIYCCEAHRAASRSSRS